MKPGGLITRRHYLLDILPFHLSALFLFPKINPIILSSSQLKKIKKKSSKHSEHQKRILFLYILFLLRLAREKEKRLARAKRRVKSVGEEKKTAISARITLRIPSSSILHSELYTILRSLSFSGNPIGNPRYLARQYGTEAF